MDNFWVFMDNFWIIGNIKFGFQLKHGIFQGFRSIFHWFL